jgi:hypothetical protein
MLQGHEKWQGCANPAGLFSEQRTIILKFMINNVNNMDKMSWLGHRELDGPAPGCP